MASAFFANIDPALPISAKNLTMGGLLCTIILLPACGVVDLSVKHFNFDKSKAKSNQLAVMSLHYDDDEFTSPYDIELIRVKGVDKGYALRAPLYTEEKGALHFTVAKQKEMKWFFGLRGRWEF
jgi:hypothetical protein